MIKHTRVSRLVLTLGLLPWASVASAHMGIDLRTYDDADNDGHGDAVVRGLDKSDTISANGQDAAMVAGPPMSPKQTCSSCHDYDEITSAYHFQLGRDEMVDSDGDGFKDDFGDVVTAEGGPLEGLPTLRDITSPGQLGAW